MDHVPTGSILMLVLVDLGLVLLMSMAFGAVVARADARPAWLGVLAGLVLPVIGPVVWAMVAVGRNSTLAGVVRAGSRPVAAWVAAAASVASAALFVVATPLPWGEVSGSVQTYRLVSDSSPADTGIGLVGTLGSAALMAAVAVVVLFASARLRPSMVAGAVAGFWLLLTLDGLIVFGALSDVSRTADSLSGGRAALEASPAAALWLCLVAATLSLVASVVLVLPVAAAAVAPTLAVSGVPGESVTAAETSAAAALAASDWASSTDWGTPAQPGIAAPARDDGWAADDGWR